MNSNDSAGGPFWNYRMPLWSVSLILAAAVASFLVNFLLAVTGHPWAGIALCCCLGCFGVGMILGRRMRDQ